MGTAMMVGRVWMLQRDPEAAVVAEGDSNKRRLMVMAVGGGGGGGGNEFEGEKMRRCLGERKRECRCIDIFS